MITEVSWHHIRVEAANDAIDLEIFGSAGKLLRGEQYKTRSSRTWPRSELLSALRKWAVLPEAHHAAFMFITDGAFGPSAVSLIEQMQAEQPSDELREFDGIRGNTKFVRDDVTAESLVTSAAENVLHLLPQRGIATEMAAAARALTLEIHQLVSQRSALIDPDQRVISRTEVCQLLNINPDIPTLTWSDALIGTYIERLGAAGDLLEISVNSESGSSVPLQQLLDDVSVRLIFGAAGSGKTIAGQLLRDVGTRNGVAVVLITAEGYVPGRLGQLIALELERVLGRPVSASMGYDAWADDTSTIIIDGVSELDPEDSRELARELRDLLLNHSGARLVLLGRDVQRLRSVLPRAADISIYATSSWDREKQKELIGLRSGLPADSAEVESRRRELAGKLGTAVENPYVLSEALGVYKPDEAEAGRAALYRRLIEARAEEHGVLDLDLVELGLGRIYSILLDSGRRYCDLYQWRLLCEQSGDAIGLAAHVLDRAANDMGLVHSVGVRSRLIPLHDSIADYLSAVAWRAGILSSPDTFHESDSGRIGFLIELGGLDNDLFEKVVHDVPLQLVSASKFDSTPLDESWLLPLRLALVSVKEETVESGLRAWKDPAAQRTWLCETSELGEEWVDDPAEQEKALKSRPIHGVTSVAGAFTSLWKRYLERELSPAVGLLPRRPKTRAEVQERLFEHLTSTAQVQRTLIEKVFPSVVQYELQSTVAELAMEVRVGEQENSFAQPDWVVYYRLAKTLSVELADKETDYSRWGISTVGFWLSQSPATSAAKNLRKALNERTIYAWL